MKRIITFVVTAFYAVTASAQEKTGLLGDLADLGNEKLMDYAKEQSGLNSFIDGFDQLVLWPEPFGGAIAFAMVVYGLSKINTRQSRTKKLISIAFVGWVAGLSLTWFSIVGWGWATLSIPIATNWKWLIRFGAKRLKIKFLETLAQSIPTKPSLAERLQAASSDESQSREKCPNPECGKMSLGPKFCAAGCGYKRTTANPTPTTVTAPPSLPEKGDVRRTEGSPRKSRNLAEARRKVRDTF